MTTFRNEPTTSPSTRHSHGNAIGWAAALRISLIESNKKGYGRAATLSTRRAVEIMLDRLADLEDRQVHRDHHAADQHPEHHHDHRFHQTGERLDQRHARREHDGERPGPARNRGFLDEVAEDRHLEHQPVHVYLDGYRTLPKLKEPPYASDDGGEDDVPVIDEEVREPHDEQGRGREIGAEVREDFLERRDHENHDDRGDDEGNDDDRDRVEQRRL